MPHTQLHKPVYVYIERWNPTEGSCNQTTLRTHSSYITLPTYIHVYTLTYVALTYKPFTYAHTLYVHISGEAVLHWPFIYHSVASVAIHNLSFEQVMSPEQASDRYSPINSTLLPHKKKCKTTKLKQAAPQATTDRLHRNNLLFRLALQRQPHTLCGKEALYPLQRFSSGRSQAQ